MPWSVELSAVARRQFKKLDASDRQRITTFLNDRVIGSTDPRLLGQALQGAKFGKYWRYRVGDYRLVCDIQDLRLVVLVVELGHRSDVYR